VRRVSSDNDDPTDELPVLRAADSASPAGDIGASSGRASPVVLSDFERVLVQAIDDPTALRERFAVAPDEVELRPFRPPDRKRPSLPLIIFGNAVVAVVAMLIVALGIALAAR
jgi:hypothetical protein